MNVDGRECLFACGGSPLQVMSEQSWAIDKGASACSAPRRGTDLDVALGGTKSRRSDAVAERVTQLHSIAIRNLLPTQRPA